MKIFINYKDNKFVLNIKKFESVNSIINSFIEEHENNFNILNIANRNFNDYILDHNGINLNKNYSLEKYNIQDESILTLYPKLKGGNGFLSFISEHPLIAFISLIIVLIPLIILPLGFIPVISSFLEIIIIKSTGAFFKFLVCDYGKITIYRRFGLFIKIVKYITLFLMIFCLVTFPLIVLCITLKGHSIMDNPQNMCKPISAGNTAGFLVSAAYFLIYFLYRGLDWIINPLLNFISKFYELDLLLSPILKSVLRIYDNLKYVILYLMPYVGLMFLQYFNFLSTINDSVEIFLQSIIDIGCGSTINLKMFKSKLTNNVKNYIPPNNNSNNQVKKESNNNILFKEKEEQYGDIFGIQNPLCAPNAIDCCRPEKILKIADTISAILEANDETTELIKNKGLYSSLVLLCEGLYDSSLDVLKNEENHSKNDIIKAKIDQLDQYMINYSNEIGASYTPGPSLFKTIFKVIFVSVVCNLFETTKTMKNVLIAMGPIYEITDMLKSGTAAGFFTTVLYFIAIIILLICAIFNYF